jgi:hypothetical protein
MQIDAHTHSHELPRTGVFLALMLALASCAEPCIDDGVGQEKPETCPQIASATESATETESASETATTSFTTTATSAMTDDATTASSVDDTSSATAGGCPMYVDHLTPKTATMILLLDQSLSMEAMFDMGTRWSTLRDTLLDNMNGVVAQYENDIRFGMTLYSNDLMTMECPELIVVPPAIGNYQSLADTFDMNMPLGDTPTGESISAVTAAFEMDPGEGQRIIVLATDGEPDLCSDPDGDGRQMSVDATAAAYALGISTFVVSVGEDVAAAHLQEVANAGAGVMPGDPDAPFYVATDQATLAMAFDEIIQGVRMCELDLDDPLPADAMTSCTVDVNGMIIPFGDPDGWQINDPMQVELLGAACDALQLGFVEVQLTCDCG